MGGLSDVCYGSNELMPANAIAGTGEFQGSENRGNLGTYLLSRYIE